MNLWKRRKVMRINKNTFNVSHKFDDLKQGDVFTFKSLEYMKTSFYQQLGLEKINAVELSNGRLTFFKPDEHIVYQPTATLSF